MTKSESQGWHPGGRVQRRPRSGSHWLTLGVRRTGELVFARRRTTTSRFYSWLRGRSDIFRATIGTVRFRDFPPTGRNEEDERR